MTNKKEQPNHNDLHQMISYSNNTCTDQFGINYTYLKDSIRITNYSHINTLLEHLNSILGPNKIIFNVTSVDEFNELCQALSFNPTNKNICIELDIKNLKKTDKLDFELLPDNVKISPHGYDNEDSEELRYPINQTFDNWFLWLDSNTEQIVIKKLDHKSKRRIIELSEIIFNFYSQYYSQLKNLTAIEKADFVYEWCKYHTSYDIMAVTKENQLKDECNYALDTVETYKRRKGVCNGRARLLKALLNNKYLQVDCYTIKGEKRNLKHEWNVICDELQFLHYYDLSFDLKNHMGLSNYTDYDMIDNSDYLNNRNKSITRKNNKTKEKRNNSNN